MAQIIVSLFSGVQVKMTLAIVLVLSGYDETTY